MTTEKFQSQPWREPQIRPEPRFNRVVIIDDNDIDLFVNETIIKVISLSREVQRESSPLQLIDKLKGAATLSEIPELIFIDLKMKGMDGFDFLEEFGQLSDFVRNKCKVVIVTGSKSKEEKNRALLNPSVIRFFMKPLDVYQMQEFKYA